MKSPDAEIQEVLARRERVLSRDNPSKLAGAHLLCVCPQRGQKGDKVMEHQYKQSAGEWACSRCHRWMYATGQTCNPAKERKRLRDKVRKARANAKRK